ncbi:hypothetical protein GH714_002260 [Hevea brasiliensis]|uniref:F-box associated beta-propeller type 1 domain-containing protein n=1 Tax=Hevea brasiliensis TaxID=3981 RepID=A0A6A6KZI0_HEVBR|nr:hypothetical protein GH714_002260 [Hevea brasiliensis]
MSDRLSQKLLTEILSRLPVKSLLKCRAALWNPSVRKIVKIHFPKVNYTSKGPFIHSLGFGFDSTTDDYKLGLEKVDNNLKYVMREGSTSAFLNGACHWVATKEDGISEVIVSFALGEEVFGEMEVPDCLVNKYIFMDIAVFDGSLLLVPFMKFTTERCFSVWMMKKYGVPGSWTKLFNISHLEWIRRLVAFRQNGKVLLAKVDGELVFYDPKTEEISATEILGNTRSFYLDTLVESLVLLDEANEFAEEEASEDDGTNGVSKEPSSSPDGVDKDLQKISEGKKNANSPMILNEANEIFEEVAPSSNSTIDKANEESKEEAQGESISTE